MINVSGPDCGRVVITNSLMLAYGDKRGAV